MSTHPMSKQRRWLRKVAVTAAGIVVLSALCVGCVMTQAPTARSDSEAAPADEGRILCFGYVDVKHGVRSLYPLQPGRIAEVLVEENQPVAAGAALLRLDDEAAKLQSQETEASLEAARVQLAQTR